LLCCLLDDTFTGILYKPEIVHLPGTRLSWCSVPRVDEQSNEVTLMECSLLSAAVLLLLEEKGGSSSSSSRSLPSFESSRGRTTSFESKRGSFKHSTLPRHPSNPKPYSDCVAMFVSKLRKNFTASLQFASDHLRTSNKRSTCCS